MKLCPLRSFCLAGLTGALGLLAASPRAAAVTAPYMDTFQTTAGGGTPTGFSTPGSGTFTIQSVGGANVYQNNLPANGGASASVLQFTNINSTSTPNFTITTTFVIDSSSIIDGNNRIGVVAFATTTAVAAGYLADVSESGNVRLIGLGSHPLTTTPTALNPGLLTLGSTYTETLAGSYSGTTLNLTMTLSGLFAGTQSTVTLTGQDTAPLTGQYFGPRDTSSSTQSRALIADFQTFAVSVPEPSPIFAALCCLGLLAFVSARRRQAARA